MKLIVYSKNVVQKELNILAIAFYDNIINIYSIYSHVIKIAIVR